MADPVAPIPVTVNSNNVIIGLDSIPTYDGLSSIEEFLAVIDETAVLTNWTDQQKISIARLKLRNKAKQFIDSEPSLKTTTNWDNLADSLRKQFIRQYVKGSAMKNFIECRQRTGETCRQYLTRLKLLANRTVTVTDNAANNVIINNKLEQDITTQFTLGLLMPIKQRVLSGNPKSLQDALTAAEREESIEHLLHPTTSRDCRAVTSQFKKKGATYQHNRSDPRIRNTQVLITCFKCKKEGHTANN